jgi:hypothetical protein
VAAATTGQLAPLSQRSHTHALIGELKSRSRWQHGRPTYRTHQSSERRR